MAILYSKESDELIKTIHSLISANNSWESVAEFFNTNKIGKQYFEDAREEVLESGNQGYSTMIIIALRNMCERIEDAIADEENGDVSILHSKIYSLESENRKLKRKLEDIQRIFGEDKS